VAAVRDPSTPGPISGFQAGLDSPVGPVHHSLNTRLGVLFVIIGDQMLIRPEPLSARRTAEAVTSEHRA